jgi:hypothetical protein
MTNLSARAYSIRARELGRHLRGAQAQSGHNGKTLARILGWSETRLSRVLSGQASSNAVDVSAFLGACGVVKQARTPTLLMRPMRRRSSSISRASSRWWRKYRATHDRLCRHGDPIRIRCSTSS